MQLFAVIIGDNQSKNSISSIRHLVGSHQRLLQAMCIEDSIFFNLNEKAGLRGLIVYQNINNSRNSRLRRCFPRPPRVSPSAAVKEEMVLKLPQGHEDTEYVHSFEIGQWEGGFYSTRTDTQTDRITDTPSTVSVYR